MFHRPALDKLQQQMTEGIVLRESDPSLRRDALPVDHRVSLFSSSKYSGGEGLFCHSTKQQQLSVSVCK